MRLLLVLLCASGCNLVSCGEEPYTFIGDDDGPTGDAPPLCNVLTQTGCRAGEKCTWIEDATTPVPLGHTSCAPAGTAAAGAACTYGAPGPTGYDNCVTGDVCNGNFCKLICDPNGTSCGSAAACAKYADLFSGSDGVTSVGVCSATCDPLADNDFLGPVIASTVCHVNEGCYRANGEVSSPWMCAAALSTSLVHRSACNAGDGCGGFANSCAPGYVPIIDDPNGTMQIVCVALCKPGNAYAGSADEQPGGIAPHACNAADARGTFGSGEHCMYSWRLDYDNAGDFVRTATSDTVGYCIDHSLYRYDSNGNGMIDDADATWPACTTMPLTGTPRAADFGCVDSTTAIPVPLKALDVRLPYKAFE